MATSRYFAGKATIAKRGSVKVSSTVTIAAEELDDEVGQNAENKRNLETREDTTSSESTKRKARRTVTESVTTCTEVQTLSVVRQVGDEAKAKRVKPSSLEAGSPFCAPLPAKYRCRVKSTCSDCFLSSIDCAHRVERPLDLLLLGHNPSVSCLMFKTKQQKYQLTYVYVAPI